MDSVRHRAVWMAHRPLRVAWSLHFGGIKPSGEAHRPFGWHEAGTSGHEAFWGAHRPSWEVRVNIARHGVCREKTTLKCFENTN